MRSVSISQVKVQLSSLLEEVAAGKEIVVTRWGKPVAKLVPFKGDTSPRDLSHGS